jgi:Endonuclease/Exonuclease/phosphatase family
LRQRFVALITAVLTVVAVAAAVSMAVTGTAGAAPPGSHYVATWNMDGANHSTENKWNSGVAQMMTAYRLVALQEAGAVPDSARHVQDHTVTGPGGQQWTVREYFWGGTITNPNSFIYWLHTGGGGNKVNLAIVAAQRADDVTVVPGPYRPALGIRVGDGFYFSLHAASGGGGDAPTLLNSIDYAVNQLGQNYQWFALGDYNREPQAGGLPFGACPPSAPTYPATDPRKYYDFMVRGSGVQLSGHVLGIQLSDHLPVRYSFPPP